MESDADRYVIIGYQSGCPFCDRAKELLTLEGAEYVFVDIGNQPAERNHTQNDLKQALAAMGIKTVPVVFHGPRLIGGYRELQAYIRSKREST